MDLRIERIMTEFKKNDNSFTEKKIGIFGTPSYSQTEAKEIWNSGIRLGIEIGLNKASIVGQKMELMSNTATPKQKEFVDKFYKLAEEYNCSIQYHPYHGMILTDLTDYGK